MFDDVNVEKLLEQDPEFNEFVREACFVAMTADKKQGNAFIGSLYSFWSIGMSKEQVADWIKSQMRIQRPPSQE